LFELKRLSFEGAVEKGDGLMWAQIGTLIMATSLIQLANGFFGTFISLRVAIEDFGPTMSGLVLSSYFAGFTLGALRCERIIERVGHIRAYAAFAGWSSPRPPSCRYVSDRCLG
jgi:MFS family permease